MHPALVFTQSTKHKTLALAGVEINAKNPKLNMKIIAMERNPFFILASDFFFICHINNSKFVL